MSKNTVTIDFDIQSIQAQIQPLIDSINKHYKDFLHANQKHFEEWNLIVNGYHERQAQTFDEHKNSLHQIVKDTKKDFSKQLESTVLIHTQQLNKLKEELHQDLQSFIDSQKGELASYTQSQISELKTQVQNIFQNEISIYKEELKSFFAQVEQRMESFPTIAQSVENKVSNLEGRLNQIETKMEDVENMIKEYGDNNRRGLQDLQQSIVELEKRHLDTIKSENQAGIQKMLEKILQDQQTLCLQITDLQKKKEVLHKEKSDD